jgi:site-specific recombinase XerD
MSKELETKLRAHLLRDKGKGELLFVNGRGRPFSANKLREQLHRLQKKLGLGLAGFHSLRHGAASSLLADGATPAVVQRQLRHSDARITLGLYGHVVGDEQRSVVQNRSTRQVN